MTKSVCLHAAFLRSPRENPWTWGLDPEDSAYPYGDQASRAHAECYGPLAFDPVLDRDGRMRGSANLYAHLSFSFCPLLLAWLERAHPETYRRILEADRASAARLGHGNALAQPYVAAPLPGLTLRDKRTVLRWGGSDFSRRFGRPAEGLWLPGLAADEETLEAVIAEGFRFTVLPARLAARLRIVGGGEADWKEVRPETCNPTRPYRWLSRRSPGAELAVFFPHERLGAALASAEALRDGETLWRAVKARFLPDDSTQLVHAVQPGELFGLELPGSAAVLGQALRNLEADGLPATNYAAFLDHFPPPQEFELAPAVRTSVRPAPAELPIPQAPAPVPLEPAWRAGLRQALRGFAEELDGFFSERLGSGLGDPWEARDACAELLGDPSVRKADELLSRRSLRHLKPSESRAALRLLEMQKRRLLMLAEAGHDSRDISDGEPLQALKNACRAAELAAALGRDLTEGLRARLAACPGEKTDAAQLWSREVQPAAVDAARAAAHFALLGHLGVGEAPRPGPRPGERFTWTRGALRRESRPLPGGRDPSWSWQSLSVRDAESRETLEASVCVHQLERLDLAAWVLPAAEEPAGLAAAFAAAPAEEFRAELCRRFGQAFFTLDALIGQERLQVLRWLMPDPSGSRTRKAFLRDWAAAVGRLRRGEDPGGEGLLELLPGGREAGVLPDQLPWAALARGAVQAALEDFLASGMRPDLDLALRRFSAAERAGLHLDLFALRSRLLVWLDGPAAGADPAERDLARALAEKLGLSPSLFPPTEACPR
ncbi:MAG: DUF3536 domain-containing protein [Elusimicrobia bacterium]|nr:DUF3536 domain-containing protein [Elusimicrobiota bacterium]